MILKEQALILSQKTKALLIGSVFKKRYEMNLETDFDYDSMCRLDIKVPSMNNYAIAVVEIRYPVSIYPLQISSPVLDCNPTKCSSEEQTYEALEKILSSEIVRNIIGGLLSEVRLDEEESKN